MPRSRPAVLGGDPVFERPIPLTGPTLELDAALHDELGEMFASGMLTNSRHVAEFERRAAAFLGAEHAVAVSSCTSGLMLVFRCLALDGEVVLPSFTFMASGHAVAWNGLEPVFADADPGTFQLDNASAAELVGARTSAVSVTHVFGAPADVDGLQRAVARAAGRDLPVVVDSAHGFGARYADGAAVGTKGTAEVFSLSPTKPLTTGEGGLVTTADAELARELRLARDYGNPGDYDCVLIGLNARMTETAGILGRRNLAALPGRLERRRELAARYAERLGGLPGVRFQEIAEGALSSHKDLSVAISESGFGVSRSTLAAALAREGIPTRNYFNPPLHQLSAYRPYAAGVSLPVTESLADEMLTLPLSSHMPVEHVDGVCEAVVAVHEHRDEIAEAGAVAAPGAGGTAD